MMTFTRKRQTFMLIILTAATLMPSYSLQGWLAGGHSASELPFWFWIWETVAWSARALIEAGAILFLFETNAQTHNQERALLMFKVMLIALITLTLGVVVASAGLGQSIADALPRPLYWMWSFAVASYAPLMLGSVGMAYRIQPHDTSDMTQQPEPIVSKVVASPKPMIQRRKESVSPEPKSVDALPEPKAVDTLPEPEIVSPEPETKTIDTTADNQFQADAKIWAALETIETQYAAYQEKKTALNASDDAVAIALGTSRSTINRVKKDYAVKYPVAVANGFHKE